MDSTAYCGLKEAATRGCRLSPGTFTIDSLFFTGLKTWIALYLEPLSLVEYSSRALLKAYFIETIR